MVNSIKIYDALTHSKHETVESSQRFAIGREKTALQPQ